MKKSSATSRFFSTYALTPLTKANCLAVCSLSVRAIIGTVGPYFLIILAALPVLVQQIINFASNISEELTAPLEIASVTVIFADSGISIFLYFLNSSVLFEISAIILTASTGYLPFADSPESITASVPSKIAFATSPASALVGLGFLIIESSICVAVITGFPALLHFLIIIFCINGTSSAGISTPRSPLATIIASLNSRISSKLSTPS